jgi:diguanylate cyclase (GGDEF)-like protein/PAS domain S-box-containing protein
LFLALAETQQWLPAPPPTPVALRLLIAGLVIAFAYLLTRFGISAMRRRIGAIRSLNQALTEAHAVAARRLGDFETLANNLPGLVVRVDHTLTVTFANRSFLHVAEADRAKVIGQPLDRILQPAQMDAIRSAIDGALAGRTMKLLAPHFDSRQHGSVFEVVIVREDDEEGRIAGFLGLLYDVTERERLQVELHHAATHDTLTGLANRLNLETALEHALTRSARSKQALALLVVDLDGFKPVNDRFGHAAGDRLLRHVAQQLRGAVRGADLVARVGGDEFVILLEQVGEAATARALAEKVLAAVAEPLADEDQTLAVGASIGVALAPEHGQTPRELFEAADKAMYEAKRSGKNQVCIGQTRAGQPAATLSD